MSRAVSETGEVLRAQFRAGFARLVGNAPNGVIRACFFVDLTATEPLWTETGIDLKPGDWVTALAMGLRMHDHRGRVHIHLWARVGHNGTIYRGTRNTHSFLAHESGPLHLTAHLPGEWAEQNGVSVGVLLWNGPTLQGLKQLAGLGELDELVDAEIDRIRNDEPPEGWQYDRLLRSAGI